MNGKSRVGLYGTIRGFVPKPLAQEPCRAGMRRAQKMSMLFSSLAVVALIASGLMVSAASDNRVAASSEPAAAPPPIDQPPPPPYYVFGYTYDASGVALAGCDVNISNLNSGAYVHVVSDATGFYMWNLWDPPMNWANGDIIHVYAEKDMWWGENQSVAGSGAYIYMNVSLLFEIPEFPLMVLPIAGTALLFVVLSRRRKT